MKTMKKIKSDIRMIISSITNEPSFARQHLTYRERVYKQNALIALESIESLIEVLSLEGKTQLLDKQFGPSWKDILGTDLPDGHVWKCPNCSSWASLAENAHAHGLSTGHGFPTPIKRPALEVTPEIESLKQENETLKAKIKTLEEAYRAACSETGSAATVSLAEYAELQAEHFKLKKEHANVHRVADFYESRIASLQMQIEELHKRHAELEAK